MFALDGQDDLLLIVRRVEALGKFLDTDDGKNLLAGVKRASNILRIEEKKDNKSYIGVPDAKLLKDAEEKALAEAVNIVKKDASAAVAKEDFAAAMTAMAKLRPVSMPSSKKSPSTWTIRRCAKTASSCSMKSAKPPARWLIFPRSKDRLRRPSRLASFAPQEDGLRH